ncbi:DUF1642 domain-containing protein [Candidatus Enterococcus clewellii]|uniref:DUF1642 domain-containing protein n=1 Tax=Candidatus Enterococcus clewellii TaxID=1834193 RepID=A0A242K348_9ENTE|nr:DUF1642 domain-containing protein [Enterococcus sp. 9E7_DIV0242]OTP13418.1 hypothetical protein A5888_002896 [Enterococcus sp. 9E7_DIV0242]
MGKVDEKMRDWKDCLSRYNNNERQNQGVLIRAMLFDLEQIKVEQEELQNRNQFLEKLVELNDETIEKLQDTSKNLTNKLKEQGKAVEIPEFPKHMVEIFDSCRKMSADAIRCFLDLYYQDNNKELNYYFNTNSEKCYFALLTGNYTVKQEQLYYIELPFAKTVNGFGRFAISCKSEKEQIVHTKIDLMPNQKTKFTESEIKAIDERYWPFAVKVEEEKDNG